MLTVRCNGKLIHRLKVRTEATSESSSTRLGGWYATILSVRRAHLILLVIEPTSLAGVLSARGISTLATWMPAAIAEILCELGASDETIDLELRAMAEIRFDRTASRSVHGTMNDYIFLMEWGAAREDHRDFLRIAMDLNRTPVGPLKYERPDDVARRALGIGA